MSDDAGLSAESWRRPRRSGAGFDPQFVRMAVLAGAGAGVLALGVIWYTVASHRTHVIPVVEADSRPIRLRPENPGGNLVEGMEEPGGAGRGQADALAPVAENPAPEALRAQIEIGRRGPALPPAAAPSLVAVPALPPLGTAPAVPKPMARVPQASMDEPPSPPAAKPAAPAAAGPAAAGTLVAGKQHVQLAALDSEADAVSEWQRLSRKMPELLGGQRPVIARADRDGKTFWRLRTGNFADAAAASAFCAQVRAKGNGCTVSGS